MTLVALHTVPLKKCLRVFVADKLAAARLRPALQDRSPRLLVEPDRARFASAYRTHRALLSSFSSSG
jgi:hypothetical protein